MCGEDSFIISLETGYLLKAWVRSEEIMILYKYILRSSAHQAEMLKNAREATAVITKTIQNLDPGMCFCFRRYGHLHSHIFVWITPAWRYYDHKTMKCVEKQVKVSVCIPL